MSGPLYLGGIGWNMRDKTLKEDGLLLFGTPTNAKNKMKKSMNMKS